jgi:hypothetical protein
VICGPYVHYDIKFIFGGEGLSQWLATGAPDCRPAVALLAGPGAPRPNLVGNLVVRWSTEEILEQRAWGFAAHASSALNGRFSSSFVN